MQKVVVNLFSGLVHIDQRQTKCVTVSRVKLAAADVTDLG